MGSEIHRGGVIAPQIVDFMWAQLAPGVRMVQDMGQGTTDSPVHISQIIETVGMVSEQTSFVSEDRSLEEDDRGGWWLSGWGLCYVEDEGGLKLALFADDRSNESVIVLEKRAGLCRSAGFLEEMGGEEAIWLVRHDGSSK